MLLHRFMLRIVFIAALGTGLLSADDNLDRGIQLFGEKKYAEAKEFFTARIKENDKNAAAHYYLGRVFLALDDHNQAVDHLQTAVEINDTVAEYHFRLGQALGLKTQRSSLWKQAFLAAGVIKEFERTIALDSTHIGGHIGAGNYYLQAPALMGGNMDKAEKEAGILLKLSPQQGRMLLIRIYEKKQEFDLAEKEYETYAASFDDTTDPYQFFNSYGYFLLNRKQHDKAIEMFEKQVQLAPADANAYDSLGDGLRAAGKLSAALSAYEKALQIDPEYEPSQKKHDEVKKQLLKNE
jgi:tetratricopeptide (TPR) repeat protein